MTIYLAGYSGHEATELKAVTDHLDALVVDIRFKPVSRRPQWNKARLEALLGTRYVGLPNWGNTLYRLRGPIHIKDMAQGLRDFECVLAQRGFESAILLCQCPDARGCHRTVVGNHLLAQGYVVQELDWDAGDAGVGAMM